MTDAAEVIEETKDLPAIDLGVTEKAITEVKDKFKGLVISDNKSYLATRKARTEVVRMRTAIKETRLNFTRKIDAEKKAIMGEEKRLVGLLEPIETELDTTVKAWEQKAEAEKEEKRRVEQERIENINNMIDSNFGANKSLELMGANSEEIQKAADEAILLEITEEYQEFKLQAQSAKSTYLQNIKNLLKECLEREKQLKEFEIKKREQELRLEKEREEFEKTKKEDERVKNIQAKIDKLFNLHDLNLLTLKVGDFESLITDVSIFEITSKDFHEFTDKAEEAKERYLRYIKDLLKQEKALNKEREIQRLEQEKNAEEARKIQEEKDKLEKEKAAALAEQQEIEAREREKQLVKEAEIKAKKEAQEEAERQAKEVEEKAKAERLEAERQEAMRPDREKLSLFGESLIEQVDKIELESSDGLMIRSYIRDRLTDINLYIDKSFDQV